jgi:hypothetical protein
MKATCMMLFTLLTILFTSSTMAALFKDTNCGRSQPCQKVVVASCASAGPTYGCDCSDMGMYYNDCMSKKTYCNQFGNVGDIDDSD